MQTWPQVAFCIKTSTDFIHRTAGWAILHEQGRRWAALHASSTAGENTQGPRYYTRKLHTQADTVEMSKCTKINKEGEKNKLQRNKKKKNEPMDDTHAMKQRKPRAGGGVGGATRTGSAFRIRRKLQPQPLQCTSRLRLQARYTPSTTTESAWGSSVKLYQYVRVCECVFETLAIFLTEIRVDKHHRTVCLERKWVKTPPSSWHDSQGLPVAHTVHPWDFLKKTRGKPNSAVIKRSVFLGASRRRPLICTDPRVQKLAWLQQRRV